MSWKAKTIELPIWSMLDKQQRTQCFRNYWALCHKDKKRPEKAFKRILKRLGYNKEDRLTITDLMRIGI